MPNISFDDDSFLKYTRIIDARDHMLPFDQEIQLKGNLKAFYMTFRRQNDFRRSYRCILFAL